MTDPIKPTPPPIDLNSLPVAFDAPNFNCAPLPAVRWFVDAGSNFRVPILQQLVRDDKGNLLWITVQTFVGQRQPQQQPVEVLAKEETAARAKIRKTIRRK